MSGFSNMREWIQKKLKDRSRGDFLIMILIGVLVMIVAIPTGEREKAPEDAQTEKQEEPPVNRKAYVKELEEELRELLEQMEGVGDCEVMITLEDDGVTYLDKNITSDADSREETTVVYDTGDGEEPYVLREEFPRVAGIVVVAEGGGNAVVVSNISRSVMSLFQIEAHKITVVKMSVQED